MLSAQFQGDFFLSKNALIVVFILYRRGTTELLGS